MIRTLQHKPSGSPGLHTEDTTYRACIYVTEDDTGRRRLMVLVDVVPASFLVTQGTKTIVRTYEIYYLSC